MTDNPQIPDPNDGRVADATRLNWVDRFCPAWSRPYLRLSRADRPAGTWLLLIPCWWGLALAIAADATGPTLFDAWIAIGCALGAFLMRGAGCTWNDLADQEYDAKVARTKSRPLPSGQVTRKQAYRWMIAQAALALCILLTFNGFAILLGVIALVPVVIYPFAKRFTWWPQIFLGIAFNWGVLLAWAAHSGSIVWPTVLLYGAGIVWTLFYDTIYAHQDKEDDALIGVKSTARLFADRTSVWLHQFLVSAVGLMAGAVILALVGPASALSVTVAIAGVWAFGWHMHWQLRHLDIDDPENCLKLFRANREAGLIPAVFFAVAMIL